jgi:Protein of unknown function (DUF3592)
MSRLKLKGFGLAERVLLMVILSAGFVFALSFLKQGIGIVGESNRAKKWIQHSAILLEFDSISDTSGRVGRIIIKVKYTYLFDDRKYTGNVFSHSQPLTSWTEEEALDLEKKYIPGNTIKIYVNPLSPKESVVQRHVRPAVWRAMTFGVIFFLAPFVVAFLFFGDKRHPGHRA